MQEETVETVNGTETIIPPTTPVKEGDRVVIASELQPKELGGLPVASRIAGAMGFAVAVRDPKHGELRVLVRHDDGTMAPYGFDELTVEQPVMVKVSRWTHFMIDMPWPGPEDSQFEAQIKSPARFVKVYPMLVKPTLAGQAPELKVRIVFLISPDAEAQKIDRK